MVNSPLIKPYFLGGGGIGGVPLDSHDSRIFQVFCQSLEIQSPKLRMVMEPKYYEFRFGDWTP